MEPIESARPRALVVDDDSGVRSLVTLLLEEEGFEVTAAAGGGEALDFLLDNSGAVDLLVVDYRMPGMDGVEFITACREAGFDCAIVMMSAYATLEVAMEAARFGCSRIIEKPFSNAHFRETVRSVMSERSSRTERRDRHSRLVEEAERLVEEALKVAELLRRRAGEAAEEKAGSEEAPLHSEYHPLLFGGKGCSGLVARVVVDSIRRIDAVRAEITIFVDDGGRNTHLAISSPYSDPRILLPVKRVSRGVGVVKLRPVSLVYPTYLHFLDREGRVDCELSCQLDLRHGEIRPLEDPFDVLGVERDASPSSIRKAYHELSMKFHPDKVTPGMREEAGAMMSKLNEAYMRLKRMGRV